MTDEQWKQDFLASIEAFKEMTKEETRSVVEDVLSGEAERVDSAVRGMVDRENPALTAMRSYELGMVLGEYFTSSKHRGLEAHEDGSPIPGHPDLRQLLSIDTADLFLDIRMLHRQTQATLLAAIRRIAESTDDVDVIHTLTDAYITLPAPGEDDEPEQP